MRLDSQSRRLGLGLFTGFAMTLPLILGQGCPIPGAIPLTPAVSVTSPLFDQTLALGELVTIVYDATSPTGGSFSVSAFHDRDGMAGTGDEVIFGTNLASGNNKFIELATGALEPGLLHLGISATSATGTTTAYASGKVTLVALPSVTFSSPLDDMTVGAGVRIPVAFDAGEGVINFTWRLFHDSDRELNESETTIAESSSNGVSTVSRDWDTIDLVPGIYYIGATVTTPDGKTTTAYAPGSVTITTGAYLEILSPRGELVVAAGTPIPIVVAAGDPTMGNPQVCIFYDPDADRVNGNSVEIDTVPASSGGTVWRPAWDFATGFYYIGAELLSTTAPLVKYTRDPVHILGTGAGTQITAVGTSTLTMRSPLSHVLLVQGQEYNVQWTTNLKIGEGTIEVFREPDVDNDGVPDGETTRQGIGPPDLDASMLSVTLDTTGVVGKFFIGATVRPNGVTPETDYAEGSLTIVPLTFWVGDLQTVQPGEVPPTQSDYFQGAIFRGHNIGDNLGSAMLVTDNYDDDGPGCCDIGPFDENGCCIICRRPRCGDPNAFCPGEDQGTREVLLVAQFGKPGLLQHGGRGAGEAYMIYGDSEQRYLGDYEVNMVGSAELPGVIFAGIIPNPHQPNTEWGLTGTTVAYTVDGDPAPPYHTEGLRSVTIIPDQDGDNKLEIVFGFPYCNSYRLRYQVMDGTHPAPLPSLGRLENSGQFLRGGVVIVASTNELLTNPAQVSRHFDRVMMLQEVGQVFSIMTAGLPPANFDVPAAHDWFPMCCDDPPLPADGISDIAFFPGEGFTQDTLLQPSFPIFSFGRSNELAARGIDPPRLATPVDVTLDVASGSVYFPAGTPHTDPRRQGALQVLYGETISLSQIDPPPGPPTPYFVGGRECCSCYIDHGVTDDDGNPVTPFGYFPQSGYMRVLGTGFYYDHLPILDDPTCASPFPWPYATYCPSQRISDARPPYGCRILGQTTTQLFTTTPTTANRFAHSVSVSGNFLLVGAPRRTVIKEDVTALRNDPLLGDRVESGEIYMLQLKRPNVPSWKYMWNSQGRVALDEEGNPAVDDNGRIIIAQNATVPAPHVFIMQDLGYTRCETGIYWQPGDPAFEMTRPFHIVGQPNDRIGDVTGLLDINNDGVDDFAVGGAGTNGGRGAVYVIYRRQPEIEADYLLERLQLDPSDLNRLNGLMILGRAGENLGTAIAGVGPRSNVLYDDYNADGYPDLLIGSPNASPGGGFQAGEVFILFGGRNLLSPQGGVTIPELRDAGDGMVIAGAHPDDHAGTTVACAGDVNHDGIADILIAAPDASPRFDSDGDGVVDTTGLDLNGDRAADDLDGDGTPDDMTGAGLVYLVLGGDHLTGTIGLNQIGTPNLPGMVFVGRKGGDHLGGGLTQNGLLSRGINSAGDLDCDGYGDFFMSSVLADPDGKTDAGEVYLVYGFSAPVTGR